MYQEVTTLRLNARTYMDTFKNRLAGRSCMASLSHFVEEESDCNWTCGASNPTLEFLVNAIRYDGPYFIQVL
jgi:hypothetical protein